MKRPRLFTFDQPTPSATTHRLVDQDIVAVSQFDPPLIDYVFDVAAEMREMHERIGGTDLLRGKVLTCLFYEPSTRTSSSFIAAMERLSGSVIPITQGVQFSSVSKGETLHDTIRTLEQYSDVIVLRHPETGAAGIAAAAATIPIINAGDGAGEHPTQALLDLFTIKQERGTLDGLHVAMVGDLRYGRTVHSLTQLLLHYDVEFSFVSPELLRLPLPYMNQLKAANKTVHETYNVADVIGSADILYVTRVQKERFSDLTQYEEVKDYYRVTPEIMSHAKDNAIIMHPLPRVNEIDVRVDSDPRAAYFRQVKNGMYIRMALLAAVLGKA
ncbi:MAG: aspartate carbamoyltransferase [Herpetosiphonaceae bacterium]|nr:aspartate carbamoyltransferase [Herpetosiphonaceae bacterium]